MYTTYQMNADDVDESLLESIKAKYRHKQIEIVVTEHDETTFLLASPANRRVLMRRIRDVKAGKNIVTPDQKQFR